MEVIHGLSAIGFTVDHKTGALFSATEFSRQFLGLVKQVSCKGNVLLFQFHDIPNMPLRDHKKMYRRLRSYVVKSQDILILIDLPARYLTLYNLTKNTIIHNVSVYYTMSL